MVFLRYVIIFILFFIDIFSIDFEYNGSLYATSTTSTQEQFLSSYNSATIYYDLSQSFTSISALKSTNSISSNEDNIINKAIISQLNISYLDTYNIVSIGREEFLFDWMMGSFDSLFYNYKNDAVDIKAFWAYSYNNLLPNYSIDYSVINSGFGVYGCSVNYKTKYLELYIYDYYSYNLRNIAGYDIFIKNSFLGLSLYGAWLKAGELELLQADESYNKVSIKYNYTNHTIDIGASITGENGLLKFFEYGTMGFKTYYLGNNTYLSNAQSLFASYNYSNQKFNLFSIYGVTNIDNIQSHELDLELKYSFNKNFYTLASYNKIFDNPQLELFSFELGYSYE